MPPDNSEPDWKVLRRVHPLALERFCDRVLGEVERVMHNGALSQRERYVESFNLHGVEPFGCDVQFIPPPEPGNDTAWEP